MSSFAFIVSVLTQIEKNVILSLKHNGIVTLCNLLPPLQNTLIINLGNNKMEVIKYNCFSNMPHLRQIKINNNNLIKIRRKSFSNLPKLLFLNLAKNSLHLLPINMMNNCPLLEILNIYHNNFFSNIVFQTLEVTNILSDDYRICCVVSSETMCPSKPPWHKSCDTLLPDIYIRITVCVISFTIIAASVSSIVLQKISYNLVNNETGAFEIIVVSINISDLLLGTSLLILWIADLFYSNKFVLKENEWTSHATCFVIFHLTFTSCLRSSFLLLFMSLARLSIVLYPLESKFKDYCTDIKSYGLCI